MDCSAAVVFGGAHENAFCRSLTLRRLHDFADAELPGEGGWLVVTHSGLGAPMRQVVQVAADDGRVEEAMADLLARLEQRDGEVVVRHGVRVAPGRAMQRHLPDWRRLLQDIADSTDHFRHPAFGGSADGRIDIPEDPRAAARLMAVGLHSGGPDISLYNLRVLAGACQVAHYYRITGDERALVFFHEMLLQLADYFLATPEGASYIADYDFCLGPLLLHFARLEHEPVFSTADRLLVINLLLAGTRSVYEYACKQWPIRDGRRTAHNHQTFPARSLLFAAEYFAAYGIADVHSWQEYARRVFEGDIWRRWKHLENANVYETLVPWHCADYGCYVGRGLELFAEEVVEGLLLRSFITTDNFMRPVDYGDATIAMDSLMADVIAARIAAVTGDGRARWFASQCAARSPRYLPLVHGVLVGPRLGSGGEPPATGVWERLGLDPQFARDFGLRFPAAHAFDKLAYRTGWSEGDLYLLVEGVGAGLSNAVSHAHHDPNGLVRLNMKGRHWVVSNGYGRLAGMTNVGRSFATRVRGPEDHNMLVLRRQGQVIDRAPGFAALLAAESDGELAWMTAALADYAGIDWFRSVVILASRFVLVIDRIQMAAPEAETGHLEWNCLGEVQSTADGWLLEQQGVYLHVQTAPAWPREQGWADRSADWQRVLSAGQYPYASFPLPKLVLHLPQVRGGETIAHATLFAASDHDTAPCRLSHPGEGVFRVTWSGAPARPCDARTADLQVSLAAHELTVRITATVSLPFARSEG